MNNAVISLENVSVVFDNHPPVLDQVDLNILDGEHTLIKGASGSGKTTLLHIMAGLSRSFQGRALLLDNDVHNTSDAMMARIRREEIGFVYQFHHLMTEFNVIENVMMPLCLNGVSHFEARQHARELLNEVGLSSNLYQQHVRSLSGGERQRVALARAVIHQPSVVFADEPTGCLDAYSSQQMLDALFALQNKHKITFVVVSHDASLGKYFKHHIHLQSGKIKKIK
ncbi:MAG: ABC transporter ATP-binding protein [Candidatus Comchoanobacterales bacterium]